MFAKFFAVVFLCSMMSGMSNGQVVVPAYSSASYYYPSAYAAYPYVYSPYLTAAAAYPAVYALGSNKNKGPSVSNQASLLNNQKP